MKILGGLIVFGVIFVVQSQLVVAEGNCWDDLDEISEAENDITDTSFRRTYVLCPFMVYRIKLTAPGQDVDDAMNPISLRANVHYKCGEDGSSRNNCILDQGDFQVIGSSIFFDEVHTAVLIEGITFQNAFGIALLLTSPGDVTFVDCVIRDNRNFAPVAIIYDNFMNRRLRETSTGDSYIDLQTFGSMLKSNQLTATSAEEEEFSRLMQIRNPEGTYSLLVTFKKCHFEGNNDIASVRELVKPGIITAEFSEDELVIEDCIFKGNNYGDISAQQIGWAISTRGPIALKNTCFIDNNFRLQAPVIVYDGAPVNADNNFGTDDDDLVCQFIAQVPTSGESDMVTCIEYDAGSCETPTRAPTPKLTLAPTTMSSSSIKITFGFAMMSIFIVIMIQ